MASFKIGINHIKKEVNVALSGVFAPESAEQFFNEFNKRLFNINSNEYVLNIKGLDFQTVTQETFPLLVSAFQLYQSYNFINIYIKLSNNEIVKMQINRAITIAELMNYEYIE